MPLHSGGMRLGKRENRIDIYHFPLPDGKSAIVIVPVVERIRDIADI